MTMTGIAAAAPGEALLAAEQAVVGAAMADAAAAETLGAIVQPRCFQRPGHGLIFAAALALAQRGGAVDWVAVLGELTRTGELRNAGGMDYVHECYAARAPMAAWHAHRIAEDFHRRDTLEQLSRAAQMLGSPAYEPSDLEQIRKLVDGALTPPQDGARRDMGALVADVIDGLERKEERGLSTGIRDLDEALGGLGGGQVILVGARPAVGKSIVLLGIAAHIAVNLGLPVLLSSLEMSAEEMTLRLLSSLARVPLHSLVQRQVVDSDWERLAKAADRIGPAPLTIDDTPGASLTQIRSALREMDRVTPPALLAVDYLQLMGGPKAENRQVAVTDLAWGLKQIARERGIPVLVAAQLNRGPEHRSDKRPLLSDLRESGALEQTADVVILLNREDAYNRESPRAGEIDLDVSKNRQGPQCVITAAFQGHYARVVDMAPDHPDWTPHDGAEDAR